MTLSLAEMARLHQASFVLPPPWSEADLAATLAGAFAFALNRPGGFLLGQVVAGEAEVLTLAVDPALRRQGTGRALMQDFLETARARGGQTAFLEVAETNTAARALYLVMGFAPAGRRKGYYRAAGQVVDALVMRRDL